MIPSSDWIICCRGSEDSGKLLMFSQIITKDIKKKTNEQQEQGNIRKGSKPGAPVFDESGCTTFPTHGQKLSEPHNLWIFMEASSRRIDQSELNHQRLCHPQRIGGEAESSKLLTRV